MTIDTLEVFPTGGGCEARLFRVDDMRMCWLTDEEGFGLPVAGEPIMIGLHHRDDTRYEDLDVVVASSEAEALDAAAMFGRACWIADAFRQSIRENLGPATLAEIDRRNHASTDAGTCATHDFCDANILMAEAYRRAGSELDVGSVANAALWSRAWSIAVADGFTPEASR